MKAYSAHTKLKSHPTIHIISAFLVLLRVLLLLPLRVPLQPNHTPALNHSTRSAITYFVRTSSYHRIHRTP